MKQSKSKAKRSKSLSLVLMSTLALGPAACGSDRAEIDESYTTFTSLEQCITSGLFSENECHSFVQAALAEKPQFTSREECESVFGAEACQYSTQAQGTESTVQQHSGSLWSPMLMGFMAGRFLGSGGPMSGSQGLYRDTTGNNNSSGSTKSYRTSQGTTVTPDAKGRIANPSPALKQSLTHNAKPTTARGFSASKGGFSSGSQVTGAGS